jgi:hypothetical protein
VQAVFASGQRSRIDRGRDGSEVVPDPAVVAATVTFIPEPAGLFALAAAGALFRSRRG